MHVHGKLFFSKEDKKLNGLGENISNIFFNLGYVFSKCSVESMNTIYVFKIQIPPNTAATPPTTILG